MSKAISKAWKDTTDRLRAAEQERDAIKAENEELQADVAFFGRA